MLPPLPSLALGAGSCLARCQQTASHVSHASAAIPYLLSSAAVGAVQVSVFRRPLHEEREQMMHQGCDQGQPEIHLRRLHFDGAEESKH